MGNNQGGCDPRPDAVLVEAVRGGDREAFGELYHRYQPPAHRFASRLLGAARSADDVVAESFTKVLKRLTVGECPSVDFRPYLFTTVRTTVYKQVAGDRMADPQADLSELVPPTVETDSVLARFEVDLAVRAFRSLPVRWQLVLRYLEVECRPTALVARMLDIQPNAVAALAFRARDALRVAYLQMHVRTDVPADCGEPAANLAAWLCGRLTRSTRQRVQQHLKVCSRCSDVSYELSDLVIQLRRTTSLVMSPAVRSSTQGEHDCVAEDVLATHGGAHHWPGGRGSSDSGAGSPAIGHVQGYFRGNA